MNEDYQDGYRHGSDSQVPRPQLLADRDQYFAGYIKGCEDRDKRLTAGQGHVPRPEWMTDAQFQSVARLYERSPDGARDRHEFFTRIQDCGIGSDRYAGITWHGAFYGIEKDGYTHS